MPTVTAKAATVAGNDQAKVTQLASQAYAVLGSSLEVAGTKQDHFTGGAEKASEALKRLTEDQAKLAQMLLAA